MEEENQLVIDTIICLWFPKMNENQLSLETLAEKHRGGSEMAVWKREPSLLEKRRDEGGR